MQRLSSRQVSGIKALLFCVFLAPSIFHLYKVLSGQVTEPADYLTGETGENALRLLLLTLLITPLVTVTQWHWLAKLRRMCGLFVFYYVLLHFLTYLLLDIQLDFALYFEDITERKYIIVGLVAFVLLIPLAITSNDYMIKKMGRAWRKLHRAVYVIAPLAILHFWWQIKNQDFTEPLVYAIITAVLFAARLRPVKERLKKRG